MEKRNGLPGELDRSDQRLAALPGVARILSSSSDMACERRAAAACRQKPEPIGCGWLSGGSCWGPSESVAVLRRSGVYLIEGSVKLDSSDFTKGTDGLFLVLTAKPPPGRGDRMPVCVFFGRLRTKR